MRWAILIGLVKFTSWMMSMSILEKQMMGTRSFFETLTEESDITSLCEEAEAQAIKIT